MKDSKGSVLVIVLITMAFVTILAVSMINVTFNEKLMSKSFDRSETAYFIAEAGVERAVSIIDKATRIRVDHVLNEEREYVATLEITEENKDSEALRVAAEIKSNIDTDIGDYLIESGSPSSRFEYYENNNSDIDGDSMRDYVSFTQDMGKYQAGDRYEFTTKNDGTESYYTINVQVGTRDSNDKRKVTIDSYGHYGQSSRHINASYYIQDVENVDPKTNVKAYSNLFNVFSKKVLSVIGNSSDCDLFNNADITGDVLVTCRSMNIKNNFTSRGELAVKADEIEFKNNNTFNGNVILDSNDITLRKDTFNGTLYTNNTSLSMGFPIRFSNSDAVSGDNTFKSIPAYQLKLLEGIPSKPVDHDNVHYIVYNTTDKNSDYKEVADSDIREGLYNVIISSVPLTMDKTSFFGLIYCTQPVVFKKTIVNGIIIANDVKVSGGSGFTATYKTPSNDSNSDNDILNEILTNITNITTGSLGLQIDLGTYSVYCQTWDTP